jgi:hypothetical protein
MDVLPDGDLALAIVRQAYGHEGKAFETLNAFASTEATRAYLRERGAELAAELPRALARLEKHGAKSARASGGPVPKRTALVRGPVNFFRPEYGRDWMIEQTGDPYFVDKVRLARRGHYYLYETLNFADGERNLEEIRQAVAAEYGPAPPRGDRGVLPSPRESRSSDVRFRGEIEFRRAKCPRTLPNPGEARRGRNG